MLASPSDESDEVNNYLDGDILSECFFSIVPIRDLSSKKRSVPWTAFLQTDREDATHTELIHAGSYTVTIAT